MKKVKSLAAVFLALFILAAIPTQAFAAETHEGVATMHTHQWRLDHYWKRLPAMLSGGEQQRVAIARTLAVHAQIILADEPTGNLDTENSTQIIQLLSRLAHEENCCVVVVTHDLEVAKAADVVFRMDSGRLKEETV